jgi:hypothetical protein
MQITMNNIKVKWWLSSVVEPLAWNINTTANYTQPNYNNLVIYGYLNTGNSSSHTVDNILVRVYRNYFITRGQVTGLTGNKLVCATKLTRQDATNQNPAVHQRDAIIY